jgi:hypothetical protein
MSIAASRAERFGELSLVEFLRSEVTHYRNDAEVVTARAIYTEIEQAVKESTVNPSFESMVGIFARKYLMNRREFLKRFRGAKKAYKRAIAFRHALGRPVG